MREKEKKSEREENLSGKKKEGNKEKVGREWWCRLREGEEKGIRRMRWRRWKEREGKGSGIRELGMGDGKLERGKRK